MMDIAIIGGGIGGLATANALHKIGLQPHVYEQASSFQPVGAGIGIGSNAMLALQQIGVANNIIKAGMPLHEQRFLDEHLHVMNTIDFTLFKKRFGEENIAIQRADLHEALFHNVDKSFIHLSLQVRQIKQTNNEVLVSFNNGVTKSFDYVIAADGIHSLIRQNLLPNSKPRFANYTCWRGTSRNKGDVLAHISSEAWSKQGRFGWAPLYNGDVYWFACINSSENDEYYHSLDQLGVASLFSHYPEPVERLIRETSETSFLHHDLYDIKPLDSFVYGRVLLLGDAAHATTPNMGQGAGQSIEDAYELMLALKEANTVQEAFSRYDVRRVKKTKKVIQLSRQIGWAAQWDHPFLVKFRNTVFPYIPKSLLFQRLTFLFK